MRRSPTHARPRSGAVALIVLVSLIVILMLVALAVDTAVLTGFVAARVANVAAPAAGQPVTFTLQPGQLATASAVTDAARRGVGGINVVNPYVCKIRLVE